MTHPRLPDRDLAAGSPLLGITRHIPHSPGPGAPNAWGKSSGKSAPLLGVGPTHLYGTAPVPRPPLPASEARDGVHAFLRTWEVTAVTGVNLVRLPPATPDDRLGLRALSPTQDRELWCGLWAEWLACLPPECECMATGPLPPRATTTTSPHGPLKHRKTLPMARHRCTETHWDGHACSRACLPG